MGILTRDNFRMQVFARDLHVCVVPNCNRDAVDAHHIIERSLWPDEGYYVENGASLCERCHILAEKDILTPDTLRIWAGIDVALLPPKLDRVPQTKWGVPTELPGEKIKYPSTPYLDVSPNQDDCKKDDGHGVFSNYSLWENCVVIVTAKMDGACVKLTRDKVTARNGEHANSGLFDWLKALHSDIQLQIPDGVTIFGEWLAFRHTIAYEGDLALQGSPLAIYAAFDGLHWVGWGDVVSLADRINHPTVPVIGQAEAPEGWRIQQEIKELAEQAVKMGHEGVVARPVYPFLWGQFAHRVAKYVREDFTPAVDIEKQIRNQIQAVE